MEAIPLAQGDGIGEFVNKISACGARAVYLTVEGCFSYPGDSRRYDLKKQQVGLSMRDFKITIARADGQSRRPILRHEIVKANSIAHAETKGGDLIRNDEQLLGICLATRREGSLLKRYAALCFDCEKTGLYTSIETLERFGAIHAGH